MESKINTETATPRFRLSVIRQGLESLDELAPSGYRETGIQLVNRWGEGRWFASNKTGTIKYLHFVGADLTHMHNLPANELSAWLEARIS